MSFVSSKPDPYPTPVDVVVYLISAIMNRVIKRFYCNVGLFMYKYDNDKLPELFADMFTPVCNIHNYDRCKSAGDHLYVTFHGTSRNQKCIKYLGPHIWNFVLTRMNPNSSIGLFKSTFRNLIC